MADEKDGGALGVDSFISFSRWILLDLASRRN
jgi:hypothetical protein